MDKMLVVVFDSEAEAYEGARALQALHDEGSITLYGHSVIVKDANGTVAVKEDAVRGPIGEAVGLLTGSLIGMIGGPVGLAIGGTLGVVGGSTYDIANLGVDVDFLDESAGSLKPGSAALVAEIEEEWVTPLDTRMETLGGSVLRRARGEVVDAMIARDKAGAEAELAALQAEYQQANAERKAKLQARIDAGNANLRKIQERTTEWHEARQREAEAKMASLKEQEARASAERKQQIAKRQAEIEASNAERKAKLGKARELISHAGELTKEAFKP